METANLFVERILPGRHERHVFAMKLRLIAFMGFWVVYLYFFRNVLGQTKWIATIVLVSFLLTAFAYYNLMQDRLIKTSLVTCLISDLTSITAIIYLTGGPYSPYFTIYLFYVFIAGILYTYLAAAIVAAFSVMYYSGFLILCNMGVIPPLILDYGEHLPVPTYTPFAHFIFAAVLLGAVVYTVKVASFFSQQRERILERRNRELTELSDRLKQLNAELKELSQVKSEFLATMSHELRTPLTAIIGFSEILIEGVMGDLTDEQRDSLKEVLHNSADLLDLINSLLDLTKIESGKMTLDVRTFDLGETLKRILGTMAPLVQRKAQTLTTDISGNMPPMTGDERKIQQAILNLIANANKFTPDGGSIFVTARHLRPGEEMEERAHNWQHVNVGDQAHNAGAMEITVADNGIGIKEEHLGLIFEMFQQSDAGTTRSFGGTGMGLALARKFVEMQGGSIWVESREGNGAKFTVVLPLLQ